MRERASVQELKYMPRLEREENDPMILPPELVKEHFRDTDNEKVLPGLGQVREILKAR